MLTIQFDRRADRPDAAGRCPIHLRAYFDGQRLRVATREKCFATEWNDDKAKFKKPFPGLTKANEYLETLTERLQARYRQLHSAGVAVTADALKAALALAVEEPKGLEVAFALRAGRPTATGGGGGAGGFEIDKRELAAGGAAHQQVGAELHPYPGGRVHGGVSTLGGAPVEQVAAVALAAHVAGQDFQQFPGDAALGGAGVARKLQHGGVGVDALGQGPGVGLAAEAHQFVFERAQARRC